MLLCTVMTLSAWAQSVINGTVFSDVDGEPVIGATVKVKGASQGAVTDANGKFSINVDAGKTLVFSYIGMQTKEAVAKNGMKVMLGADEKMLDEVVVTAMGITRSEKTLGYSATTVKADELTGAHTTNVADALSGKVAGVQVSATSSDPGSVSNIVIRGFSSINGSNQPLYVIDGVPMQSTTISSQGKNVAAGGIGNVAADDIESMTILKGAAATALYGSRAANGVVVVTTKSGKKGANGRDFTIDYSGSVQARQVSLLPDMQNKYGQGWNGAQTWIENGSWGPAFDGTPQVYGPVWNNQELIHKYDAVKSNVRDFFDLGWSQNHNIALSGVSNDSKMSYYLSYGYAGDNGIMPSDADTYTRNTVAARASYQASKWLKVSTNINFARSETDAVGTYQGTSVIDGLYEMPRDISIVDMKDLSSPFNTPEAYYTPYGITNPYWALANNYNHTSSKQIYGKIQADIKPMNQLTLSYRMGFDYTDFDRKIGFPEIKLDDALINDDKGYAPSNMNQAGYVFAGYGRRYETNHDFLANWADKYFDSKLDVNINAGLNINERAATSLGAEADELTFETGYWQLSNGSSWTDMSESQSKRRLMGLFGDVTLGWDDTYYLDLTARNDWSSTLPIGSNSFFYPGATFSWIFTKLIPENKILSFGKLRLAYGKTGNDADPYMTSAAYTQSYSNGYYGSNLSQFPMNGTNAFQKTATAGSNNLRPEMTKEFEVGVNLQFFQGRIGIDAAYYDRKTSDQIFTLPVDPATGYSYMVTNFGDVSNKGFELVLNTTPVKIKDFRWDLNFNFSINKNKVLTLPESLEGGKVSIYNFSAGNDAVYMYAEQGRPMGEFYTYLPAYWDNKTYYTGYDDAGNPILNTKGEGDIWYNYEGVGSPVVGDDGQPILSTEVMDTGKNMNSDWAGGVSTNLTWKSITLSAALDIRKGGYMFSRSKNLMQFTGNGTVTLYNDRNPFIIPNSVYTDGTENFSAISMSDGSYQNFFNDYGWGQGGEAYLIDRSFVKLRNISLSWSLPKQWIAPLTLRDVTLTAFCNNVFTWTAKDNYFIDPETTTVSQASYGDLATQFGELYANPSCRIWGLNLNVKF